MTEPDIFPENITPDNIHEIRVGQIGTMKGKLEGVRFGAGRGRCRMHAGSEIITRFSPDDPSLVIIFADWNMLAAAISDYHTAKGIPYPLGTYVAVKVQCISEDCDLMALAIWELGDNPVPVPLIAPTHYRMIERATTIPR